jgi:hypothetical protein
LLEEVADGVVVAEGLGLALVEVELVVVALELEVEEVEVVVTGFAVVVVCLDGMTHGSSVFGLPKTVTNGLGLGVLVPKYVT